MSLFLFLITFFSVFIFHPVRSCLALQKSIFFFASSKHEPGLSLFSVHQRINSPSVFIYSVLIRQNTCAFVCLRSMKKRYFLKTSLCLCVHYFHCTPSSLWKASASLRGGMFPIRALLAWGKMRSRCEICELSPFSGTQTRWPHQRWVGSKKVEAGQRVGTDMCVHVYTNMTI